MGQVLACCTAVAEKEAEDTYYRPSNSLIIGSYYPVCVNPQNSPCERSYVLMSRAKCEDHIMDLKKKIDDLSSEVERLQRQLDTNNIRETSPNFD